MNESENIFNPFKQDDKKKELSFSFSRMIHRIGSNITNYLGDGARAAFANIDPEEMGLFYSIYIESEQYRAFQVVLDQFPNITETLKNEIIVISVLPRFYKDFLKQNIEGGIGSLNDKMNTISLKKSSETSVGNKAEIKTPQLKYTDALDRNLAGFFDNIKLNEETQNLSNVLEKQVERIESSDIPDLNEKILYYLNMLEKSFQFINKYLPKQSSFRQLVILHLNFIIRQEDLFPNIDQDKKTNAQITQFIIELFQAVDYFEVDTAQDQVRMVNNAFHKKVDLLFFKKLKEKFEL